jgi:hypothetical protein
VDMERLIALDQVRRPGLEQERLERDRLEQGRQVSEVNRNGNDTQEEVDSSQLWERDWRRGI